MSSHSIGKGCSGQVAGSVRIGIPASSLLYSSKVAGAQSSLASLGGFTFSKSRFVPI